MHRLSQRIVSLILCAALVWTTGEGAQAALSFREPTPALFIRFRPQVICPITDPAYFTEQALVQRLVTPLRVNWKISLGRLWKQEPPPMQSAQKAPLVVRVRSILHAMGLYGSVNLFHEVLILAVTCLLISHFSPQFTGVYQACGLIGILSRRRRGENQILPARVARILLRFGKITKERGEQAAGGVQFVRDRSGHVRSVRKRIVNQKRASLPDAFDRALRRSAAFSRLIGLKPLSNMILVLAHYRYGTSSAPSVIETQPPRWMPERRVTAYAVRDGKLVLEEVNLATYITHNGDLDYWQGVDYVRLGLWLERVLNSPLDTEGDSPRVAGMMDFLLTQGMWDASIRLAYQWNMTKSHLDAFGGKEPPQRWKREKLAHYMKRVREIPNQAPSPEQLARWASVFENVFDAHRSRLLEPGATNLAQTNEAQLSALREALLVAIEQDEEMGSWKEENRNQFVKTALHVFINNDLHTATRLFMSHAQGSFSLGITSTLEPEHVVLVAKGQPLSVAFHPSEGEVYWASEAAAFKTPPGDGQSPIPYRLDLDEANGEIVDLSIDHFRVFSLAENRPLTEEELHRDRRLIDLIDNPLITPLPVFDKKDMVKGDLNGTAKVLTNIHADWADPESNNRYTASRLFAHFLVKAIYNNLRHRIGKRFDDQPAIDAEVWQEATLLAEAMRAKTLDEDGYREQAAQFASAMHDRIHVNFQNDEKESSQQDVDLVISGIGDSQWEAEHYANIMRQLFPSWNIVCESSNKLLRALHRVKRIEDQNHKLLDFEVEVKGASGKFKFGKKTPVLLVSQHGQTYAVLNSASKLQKLHNELGISGVFVMSGEIDTPLGKAVGQSFAKGAPFLGRIFVNGSGRRPAEASTIATTAVDYSFAELSLCLVNEFSNILPTYRNLGHGLNSDAVARLEKARQKFLASVPNITGVRADGSGVEGETANSKLVKQGRKWSQHVLEAPVVTWISWGLIALFVFWLRIFPSTLFIPAGWDWTARVFDFLFYTAFLRWGLPGLLRFGRQKFARPGKRTIVIGDPQSHVHQLLENYVSRLFSMAHKEQAVDVHGGKTDDHFIHRFAHRIVRGTLMFFGVPDNRSPETVMTQDAVYMVGKQSKGIQNGIGPFNAGPEVVAIGDHLPDNPNAIDISIALNGQGEPDKNGDPLVEGLEEDLFGSLRRMIGAQVFFWAMAREVARFPTMGWPIESSQSGTRSATTRSPIPAPVKGDEAGGLGDHLPLALQDPVIPLRLFVAEESATSAPTKKSPPVTGLYSEAQQQEITQHFWELLEDPVAYEMFYKLTQGNLALPLVYAKNTEPPANLRKFLFFDDGNPRRFFEVVRESMNDQEHLAVQLTAMYQRSLPTWKRILSYVGISLSAFSVVPFISKWSVGFAIVLVFVAVVLYVILNSQSRGYSPDGLDELARSITTGQGLDPDAFNRLVPERRRGFDPDGLSELAAKTAPRWERWVKWAAIIGIVLAMFYGLYHFYPSYHQFFSSGWSHLSSGWHRVWNSLRSPVPSHVREKIVDPSAAARALRSQTPSLPPASVLGGDTVLPLTRTLSPSLSLQPPLIPQAAQIVKEASNAALTHTIGITPGKLNGLGELVLHVRHDHTGLRAALGGTQNIWKAIASDPQHRNAVQVLADALTHQHGYKGLGGVLANGHFVNTAMPAPGQYDVSSLYHAATAAPAAAASTVASAASAAKTLTPAATASPVAAIGLFPRVLAWAEPNAMSLLLVGAVVMVLGFYVFILSRRSETSPRKSLLMKIAAAFLIVISFVNAGLGVLTMGRGSRSGESAPSENPPALVTPSPSPAGNPVPAAVPQAPAPSQINQTPLTPKKRRGARISAARGQVAKEIPPVSGTPAEPATTPAAPNLDEKQPAPSLSETPEVVHPVYVQGRPVVTLTWKEMAEALVKADQNDSELQQALDAATDKRKSKESRSYFTVAPSYTLETGGLNGLGVNVTKDVKFGHDPLASVNTRLVKIDAELAYANRALALQARLAALADARAALQAAETEEQKNEARQQIEGLVLPVLSGQPAEARIELPADADGGYPIYTSQASASIEARIAALTLAKALEQSQGAAQLHFISLLRKISPTGFLFNANPIFWGTFGHLGIGTPEWTKYSSDWSKLEELLQGAANDYLTARQASVERWGTLSAGSVTSGYQDVFKTDTLPVLSELVNYLQEKMKEHPGQKKDIAALLEKLEAMRDLPSHPAPAASTDPQDQTGAPDVGSLASRPHITFSAPVVAGTPGSSSASPAATTIENNTWTASGPGVSIHQLINGRRLSARQKKFAEAVASAQKLEKQGGSPALVARYKVALIAAQLSAKERRELLVALSAQKSPHFQYYVISPDASMVERGLYNGFRHFLLIFNRSSWTPQMAEAVLHAKFSTRGDPKSAQSLFEELMSVTPESTNKEESLRSALEKAWNEPLSDESEELALAKLRQAEVKSGKPAWTSSFNGSISPFISIADEDDAALALTLNRGIMGSGTLGFASNKQAKVDYKAQVKAAEEAVRVQKEKDALKEALASGKEDVAKGKPQTIISAADPLALAKAVADAEQPLPSGNVTSSGRHVFGIFNQDVTGSGFWQAGQSRGFNVSGKNFAVGPLGLGDARAKEKAAAERATAASVDRARRQIVIDFIGLLNRQAVHLALRSKARTDYMSAEETYRKTLAQEGTASPHTQEAFGKLSMAVEAYYSAQGKLKENDILLRSRLSNLPSDHRSSATTEVALDSLPPASSSTVTTSAPRSSSFLGSLNSLSLVSALILSILPIPYEIGPLLVVLSVLVGFIVWASTTRQMSGLWTQTPRVLSFSS